MSNLLEIFIRLVSLKLFKLNRRFLLSGYTADEALLLLVPEVLLLVVVVAWLLLLTFSSRVLLASCWLVEEPVVASFIFTGNTAKGEWSVQVRRRESTNCVPFRSCEARQSLGHSI